MRAAKQPETTSTRAPSKDCCGPWSRSRTPKNQVGRQRKHGSLSLGPGSCLPGIASWSSPSRLQQWLGGRFRAWGGAAGEVMPSRGLSLAIIAFWLGMSAWMFWAELWPQWQPGQPPPFQIDMVEEVQQVNPPHTYWNVLLNRPLNPPRDEQVRPVLHAETWIEFHPGADEFSLHAKMHSRPGDPPQPGLFQLQHVKSECRIKRPGQLRATTFEANGTFSTKLLPAPAKGQFLFSVALRGEVREDRFFSHLHAELTDTQSDVQKVYDRDLEPIIVSRNGVVLQPLHPLNRIEGLQPGQTWTVPVVDPFTAALAASSPLLGSLAGGEHSLRARVRLEPDGLPESLPWRDRRKPCLVIDYEGDGMEGHTWVEQDTGRVLCQEAILMDQRWTLLRQAIGGTGPIHSSTH
jgi:hypothetical protein